MMLQTSSCACETQALICWQAHAKLVGDVNPELVVLGRRAAGCHAGERIGKQRTDVFVNHLVSLHFKHAQSVLSVDGMCMLSARHPSCKHM